VAWNTGGIKTIKLNVIEIGCSSNDSLKITVNTTGTKPVPAFTANLTTLNEGQTTTFTDQSLNSPTSWKWTFNGGTPATSITANQAVKYNTAGVYSVKLVVQNSYGKDSLTKSGYITVKGKPIASFSGSPTTITAGSSVTFADESANYPTTWKWTCTGGTPLNPVVANPTVTYNTAGTFDVKLVVTNSLGADSMTKTGYIKVNPAPQKPVADFSGNKTVIKKGDSVTFTDLSTNSPTALKWTFQGGSPLTSTTASQVVKYNTVGSFDVKLKATNAFGSDSVTKIKYIQVNPVSIEDRNGEQLFSMYPSPAKEKLFVETFREFKANSVEVLDITGRIKYEIKFATMGSLISIDISLLPKGLYILRIAGENANFTGKFSKE
jgi:PKD repeat protein